MYQTDLNFCSDYTHGCHPEIMNALCVTNMDASVGYGRDKYSDHARKLIADVCGLDIDKCLVEMLIGGTQTNATVIDALLRGYEGVMAAESAHINVHEAGAIEASGHKVIVLPSYNGMLCAADIDRYVENFYADETYPHCVAPGLVYISHPTELGTLYSLRELTEISSVCRKWNIRLYVDGARMAYALTSPGSDVTLRDLARLADIFYIGGTKCGTLFGEAVVARDKSMLPGFFSIIKQHGALLAKGRLLGIQFSKLFEKDLYYRIGSNGIEAARRIRDVFKKAGYELYIDSPTNQQFFILPNEVIDALFAAGVGFELWGARHERQTPVRFVADWSTTMESIDRLSEILENITDGLKLSGREKT